MSTIPTTFKSIQASYTVVGGKKVNRSHKYPEELTILILNRGGKYFRASMFQELEEMDVGEILSIEGPSEAYDVEALARKHTSIRFLLLHDEANNGEKVNIGINEARGRYVLVMWNDMRIPAATFSSRFIERIDEKNSLCTVPIVQNPKLEIIPSIMAPAFYDSHLKVLPLQPKKDGVPSLYPFDYAGIYHRKKFILTGGYDYGLKNSFWQKMDFGFRSHMWGEHIVCNTGFKMEYSGEIPSEETTPDENYKIFYLKNLSVRYNGDGGYLPYSRFLRYFFKAGKNFVSAFKEFREVRKWVRINKYRFQQDARSVTELWEDPEL